MIPNGSKNPDPRTLNLTTQISTRGNAVFPSFSYPKSLISISFSILDPRLWQVYSALQSSVFSLVSGLQSSVFSLVSGLVLMYSVFLQVQVQYRYRYSYSYSTDTGTVQVQVQVQVQ